MRHKRATQRDRYILGARDTNANAYANPLVRRLKFTYTHAHIFEYQFWAIKWARAKVHACVQPRRSAARCSRRDANAYFRSVRVSRLMSRRSLICNAHDIHSICKRTLACVSLIEVYSTGMYYIHAFMPAALNTPHTRIIARIDIVVRRSD